MPRAVCRRHLNVDDRAPRLTSAADLKQQVEGILTGQFATEDLPDIAVILQ